MTEEMEQTVLDETGTGDRTAVFGAGRTGMEVFSLLKRNGRNTIGVFEDYLPPGTIVEGTAVRPLSELPGAAPDAVVLSTLKARARMLELEYRSIP